jgi:hypothetical protein
MEKLAQVLPISTKKMDEDELFPVTDEDILPIQNPLRIMRPRRFGTKRENLLIAQEAVRRLLEGNSALLSYLVLKQWSEILSAALDDLKDPALNDYQRFFTGPTDVHGVEVSTRAFGSGWKYPAEVEDFEVEVNRMKDQLKARKKEAEADGTARKFKGEGKSLVVTFRK